MNRNWPMTRSADAPGEYVSTMTPVERHELATCLQALAGLQSVYRRLTALENDMEALKSALTLAAELVAREETNDE